MSLSQRLVVQGGVLPKAWLLILGVGLFVQLMGLLFNNDGSRYATQTNLLLFAPALILLLWHRLSLATWCQVPGVLLLCLLGWVLLTGLLNSGSSSEPMHWLRIVIFILLYVFAVGSLARYDRAVTWLLIAGVVMAAVFAWLTLYYQFGVLDKSFEYRLLRLRRLSELGWGGLGDLKNPIVAGLYYGVFAVLLTYLFVRLTVRSWQVVVMAVAMLGLLTYIFFTVSRGAWFATAVGCLVVLLLFPNIKSRILIGLGGLFVLVVILMLWSEIRSEIEVGVNGRELIWNNWVEGFPEFWLRGAGAGADIYFKFPVTGVTYKHAHSLYLQLWYEYGVVGVICFASLLLSLLWKGWVCRAEPIARLGLALLVFAMLAMVSDVYAIFHRPSPYWVLLWFPVGILLGVQPPRKSEVNPRGVEH